MLDFLQWLSHHSVSDRTMALAMLVIGTLVLVINVALELLDYYRKEQNR